MKFGTISYLPCTDSYGPDAVDLGATHGFQAQHLCGVPAPCTSSTYVDNGGGRYVNAGEILILAGRGPAVGRPTCYKGVAAQLPPSHNYVDVYVNGQFYNRDYY